MKKMMITGASGHLGRAIVEELLKTVPPAQIAILVRDEKKVQDLQQKGVDVRIGDYHRPETLRAAFEGMDRLLLISSSDFNNRLGQHKNAVDAAVQAGVQHILYTGIHIRNMDHSPIKPLLGDHIETENYIRASGLTYTLLQNGLYSDIVPMFLGPQVLETGVYFPAGDGKVAFAPRQEMAIAIAKILQSDAYNNQAVPLAGSESVSFADIAETLSKDAGKTVPYISPTAAEYESALRNAGVSEDLIFMSAAFAAAMKNGDFDKPDPTLSRLLAQ